MRCGHTTRRARRRRQGCDIAPLPDGHWEHQAPALATNVGAMRQGVVAFAARHGASRDAQADISLAVSEALTNSVVHAFVRQPAGTMGVLAEAAADVLLIRITDDGSGMAPRADSPGMGVGLTVIARLSSSVEFHPGPRGAGTEVCLRIDVPGMRRTAAHLL